MVVQLSLVILLALVNDHIFFVGSFSGLLRRLDKYSLPAARNLQLLFVDGVVVCVVAGVGVVVGRLLLLKDFGIKLKKETTTSADMVDPFWHCLVFFHFVCTIWWLVCVCCLFVVIC